MTLCAAPNCQPRGSDTAARALDGLLLCGHHTHKIGHDAGRLAVYHDELAEVLAHVGGGTAGVTHNHPGLSVDQTVADTRHHIRQLLVGTVRTIAHQRGVRLPCRWLYDRPLPAGVQGPRRAVFEVLDDRNDVLAQVVADHSVWLAARPDAGAISDRYAYLRRRAWSLLHIERTVVVLIGPCPMLVAGHACRGTVRALVRRTDTLLPLAVSCEDPEHSWPVEELARLGRFIGLKQGRWASAAELAILYGVPLRRIQQLASLHRWERTRDGLRPTLYSALDARATPVLRAALVQRTTMEASTDGRTAA